MSVPRTLHALRRYAGKNTDSTSSNNHRGEKSAWSLEKTVNEARRIKNELPEPTSRKSQRYPEHRWTFESIMAAVCVAIVVAVVTINISAFVVCRKCEQHLGVE